jgi:hypothetical protein
VLGAAVVGSDDGGVWSASVAAAATSLAATEALGAGDDVDGDVSVVTVDVGAGAVGRGDAVGVGDVVGLGDFVGVGAGAGSAMTSAHSPAG